MPLTVTWLYSIQPADYKLFYYYNIFCINLQDSEYYDISECGSRYAGCRRILFALTSWKMARNSTET